MMTNYVHVVEGSFRPYGIDNALNHLRALTPLELPTWEVIDAEIAALRAENERFRKALDKIMFDQCDEVQVAREALRA